MRNVLLVLVVLGGCSPKSLLPAESPLQVGMAEVDITPPVGLRMAGSFRERISTGTKDPLKAKALVIRHGETSMALVVCDLVGVPVGVTFRAREMAEKRTGIPAAHIGIAATHSHTGPLFFGAMCKVLQERAVAAAGKDPLAFDYAGLLITRIVQAIEKAQAGLRYARLEAGVLQETGLSFHRRFHMKDGTVRTNPGSLNPEIVKPAGPIDPDLSVLLVRDDRGARGALTVFALHCDTTGGTEYSGDYPAHLERELRTTMGEEFISLFGAGTCGDINHIDVTRKDRKSAPEIGAALGRRLVPEIPKLQPLAGLSPAVRNNRVQIPLQRFTPDEVAAARSNAGKIGSKDFPFLDAVRTAAILHLQDLPAVLPLEVQVFRLSRDAAIVTLPGEVFVDLGLAIKKASPFKYTYVIELANDSPAYIPTREGFARGAYEVVNSRIEAGGGERLAEEAIRMLRELKP